MGEFRRGTQTIRWSRIDASRIRVHIFRSPDPNFTTLHFDEGDVVVLGGRSAVVLAWAPTLSSDRPTRSGVLTVYKTG